MSRSLRGHWFFDTVQQEIFIGATLRPYANRWGLTSAEWQIPHFPNPYRVEIECLSVFASKHVCKGVVIL